MQDIENTKGASRTLENPLREELLEIFDELEERHGLSRLDLPYEALSALIRHMNTRLTPDVVAEYCEKISALMGEMGADMRQIDKDRRARLN